MKVQIPETKVDTIREEVENELSVLIERFSEAKQANTLLRNQLQNKGLLSTLKELDSPTDHDLSSESQEILEIFKMQAARSILVLQIEDYNYYGDDEYSDEEEALVSKTCVAPRLHQSLVEVTTDNPLPTEPEEMVIVGEEPSYCRDCCALDSSHCAIS